MAIPAPTAPSTVVLVPYHDLVGIGVANLLDGCDRVDVAAITSTAPTIHGVAAA